MFGTSIGCALVHPIVRMPVSNRGLVVVSGIFRRASAQPAATGRTETMTQGKDVLAPHLAATIVMECAVPMSKIVMKN